jgi:hypothetical protein
MLLGLLLGLSACAASTPHVVDDGPRTALEVGTETLTQEPTVATVPCPTAHYRLPVVTQVTVPDTIVGGVLIPQYTTYVVVQPGAWQVVHTATVRQPGQATVPAGCLPLPGGH